MRALSLLIFYQVHTVRDGIIGPKSYRPILCEHPPRVEQGTLTFEKDATFSRCYNQQVSGKAFNEAGEEVHDASSGGGGAVYHHAKGTMHFMGKLAMTNNEAYVFVSVRDYEGRARRSGSYLGNCSDTRRVARVRCRSAFRG